MTASVAICSMPDDVKEKLKKFRLCQSQSLNALILKIDRSSQSLCIDEELEGEGVDAIRDALPDRQPRFVVVSYPLQHDDGRRSYPLCIIYSSPSGCQPEIQMLYAGTKNSIMKECDLSKSFEIREIEDLTEEYLIQQLKR